MSIKDECLSNNTNKHLSFFFQSFNVPAVVYQAQSQKLVEGGANTNKEVEGGM